MFQNVTPVPSDPILGLLDTFRADPRPDKVNLTVGVYQDDHGTTPILECVRQAELQLLRDETTKDYLGMAGNPAFPHVIPPLLWSGAETPDASCCATFQTPGGSGALRVVADFLHEVTPQATVWLSQPTWPNHPGIFQAAGLRTQDYRYFNPSQSGLDFPAMLQDLQRAADGDCVVLHACCHNPTGADLSDSEWTEVGQLLADRHLVPVLDYAYQGFARGLEQDATGLRVLSRLVPEYFVCASFSKNFGLYRERIGGLLAVGPAPPSVASVASRLRISIRTNYSNPPAHGGAVVVTFLQDSALRDLGMGELSAMRTRIATTRRDFTNMLQSLDLPRDFSFLNRQFGMFALTGLSPNQVRQLNQEHGIYLVGSGRMNVAGLNSSNLERVARAFASVVHRDGR